MTGEVCWPHGAPLASSTWTCLPGWRGLPGLLMVRCPRGSRTTWRLNGRRWRGGSGSPSSCPVCSKPRTMPVLWSWPGRQTRP